jgi:hypothetical protein
MSGESSNQPSALAVEQEKRERAQAERLENAAMLAEERIRARQRRLRAIQKHDREIDKLLLFGGMDESPFQEKPESGSWFTSIDMSGEENYILHYMGTYVKNQWSKERLKSIEKLLTNADFVTKPFAGHLGVGTGVFAAISTGPAK